jgi:hypothetical protein
MLNRIVLSILTLACFAFSTVKAQSTNLNSDTLRVNRKAFHKVVAFESAYYAGAMLVMQKTWYRDRKVVPFHFFNDNKGYLQVDKFGHTFGSYFESYIGYRSLLNSGFSKKQALIYGATLGLILQTPIEIMDGIHEGWGFSWGDMLANAAGSGLVIGQELLFNDQAVKCKFSYWESRYSRNANGYLGKTTLNRLLKDYNGHTYWFSVSAKKVISRSLPPWLNIAAGYGANGMYGEFRNISNYNGVEFPQTERYRQYLLSLDIDWTKIKTESGFLKVVLRGLTFIKLPLPAIEYNSKGNFRGYWIYF